MPNRSKTDIVERVKLLEEEVYPSGTNTPDTVTAGEDGKLDLVNTGEIDIGKLVSALDVSGYDITGVGELESDSLNTEDAVADSFDSPNHLHQFTQSTGVSQMDGSFRVEPWGAGVEFSQLFDHGFNDPEGCAYNDDRIFLASADDDTIYEFDRQGTQQSTFSLPSGAGKSNFLEYRDGSLWAHGDDSNTLYQIDWADKTIVATVSTSEYPIFFIPYRDGRTALAVYDTKGYIDIYDWEAAKADGDINGNRELYTNLLLGLTQAGCWANGYVYLCSHSHIVKAGPVFVDDLIQEEWGLASRVVWNSANRSGLNGFEQATYDDDRGVLYAAGANGLYELTEQTTANLGSQWSRWDIGDGGFGAPKSLALDASQSTDDIAGWGLVRTTPAIATCWFYDDTETSSGNGKVAYATYYNGSGPYQFLGVNTDQSNGDANYYWYNSDDGWNDTGVSRPQNPQWVALRFIGTGTEMKFRISKDAGSTWQDAGSTTNGHTQMVGVGPGITKGTAKMGAWDITPIQ